MRARVAVIGAGVVGVNTALEVQRRHPEFRVTVIADKFNGETLSDGAAGLFRPDTYVFGPSLQVSQWVLPPVRTYTGTCRVGKPVVWVGIAKPSVLNNTSTAYFNLSQTPGEGAGGLWNDRPLCSGLSTAWGTAVRPPGVSSGFSIELPGLLYHLHRTVCTGVGLVPFYSPHTCGPRIGRVRV